MALLLNCIEQPTEHLDQLGFYSKFHCFTEKRDHHQFYYEYVMINNTMTTALLLRYQQILHNQYKCKHGEKDKKKSQYYCEIVLTLQTCKVSDLQETMDHIPRITARTTRLNFLIESLLEKKKLSRLYKKILVNQ